LKTAVVMVEGGVEREAAPVGLFWGGMYLSRAAASSSVNSGIVLIDDLIQYFKRIGVLVFGVCAHSTAGNGVTEFCLRQNSPVYSGALRGLPPQRGERKT
jgi:hypothetical protein